MTGERMSAILSRPYNRMAWNDWNKVSNCLRARILTSEAVILRRARRTQYMSDIVVTHSLDPIVSYDENTHLCER